jgi:hypothetical protein
MGDMEDLGEIRGRQGTSKNGRLWRFGMKDAERFRKDTVKDSGRSGGHTWRSGENLERS